MTFMSWHKLIQLYLIVHDTLVYTCVCLLLWESLNTYSPESFRVDNKYLFNYGARLLDYKLLVVLWRWECFFLGNQTIHSLVEIWRASGSEGVHRRVSYKGCFKRNGCCQTIASSRQHCETNLCGRGGKTTMPWTKCISKGGFEYAHLYAIEKVIFKRLVRI